MSEVEEKVRPKFECEACDDTGAIIRYFACGTPWASTCRHCTNGRLGRGRAFAQPAANRLKRQKTS